MMASLECLQADLDSLAGRLSHGCGNAGCVIKRPLGMHTNGRCTCSPSDVSKRLLEMAVYAEQFDTYWRPKP